MICPHCGSEIKDGAVFCESCGSRVASEPPKAAPEAQPVPPVQPQVVVQQAPVTQDTLPEKFRPLSAWAYFGYSILFAIPIVGFIFLIVFSFSGKNINRRSYARSYWCWLIIAVIVFVILLATGGIAALIKNFG